MRIVVLNECFFEESHREQLKKLGTLDVFADTDTEQKTIARLQNADVAIADMYVATLNERVLSQAKKLRLLALNTTGYDHVDLAAAKKQGITVTNAPGYATEAVAEHAIAFMLAAAKKLFTGDRAARETRLEVDPGNPEHRRYFGTTLQGKTLGIIGYGAIGTQAAKLAAGLGMRIIVHTRTPREKSVAYVDLDTLLRESDVVSLHTPLTQETEGMIDADAFSRMKETAILVNTARGRIVDTDALEAALRTKRIAAAAIDGIAHIPAGHPLFSLDTFICTPHVGGLTTESVRKLADLLVKIATDFSEGRPVPAVQ